MHSNVWRCLQQVSRFGECLCVFCVYLSEIRTRITRIEFGFGFGKLFAHCTARSFPLVHVVVVVVSSCQAECQLNDAITSTQPRTLNFPPAFPPPFPSWATKIVSQVKPNGRVHHVYVCSSRLRRVRVWLLASICPSPSGCLLCVPVTVKQHRHVPVTWTEIAAVLYTCFFLLQPLILHMIPFEVEILKYFLSGFMIAVIGWQSHYLEGENESLDHWMQSLDARH